MEHSEHYREKQYAADHSLGHREFWRMILAEVRADESEKAELEGLLAGIEDMQANRVHSLAEVEADLKASE